MARLIIVEMEGLWVELLGKSLDRLAVDPQRRRGEFLADPQVLEIADTGHRVGLRTISIPLVKSAGRSGRNHTPDATAADNITP
jgi:hypothetical protein